MQAQTCPVAPGEVNTTLPNSIFSSVQWRMESLFLGMHEQILSLLGPLNWPKEWPYQSPSLWTREFIGVTYRMMEEGLQWFKRQLSHPSPPWPRWKLMTAPSWVPVWPEDCWRQTRETLEGSSEGRLSSGQQGLVNLVSFSNFLNLVYLFES